MLRQKKLQLIITFHTTTEAMAAENFCKLHQLPGRLIPVPRQITASCGLAWMAEADRETEEKLQSAFRAECLSWEVWQRLEI